MTLSNFDWTDKTSARWFILLPSGHEGPYDLQTIRQRCELGQLRREAKIWAQGLTDAVSANRAIQEAEPILEIVPEAPLPAPEPEASKSLAPELAENLSAREEATDVPEEDEIPPIPVTTELPAEPATTPPAEEAQSRKSHFPYFVLGAILVIGLIVFVTFQWLKGQEHFQIHRQAGMSPDLHKRIESEISFKGWGAKIFFKEFTPADLSRIWLVTASFQTCEVEAEFRSLKDKLISLKDEPISFKSSGLLKNHIVELSRFDFRSGTKVVPGLYELDVRARNCEWDGVAPALANLGRSPDDEYVARTKVILYPKGAQEFNDVLDKLLAKKLEKLLEEQKLEELFWQDLQQKFQTLLAISLQIEQHFLDVLREDPKAFQKNLAPAINLYTKKFGHFLTNFVAANQDYFNQLGDVKDRAKKRNYELQVNLTSKRVGEESMRLIEELQGNRNPSKAQLRAFEDKLKESFRILKSEINEKIIQVSEDRSR